MGSINNSLIFGGVDSADYGLLVAGDGTFNAPERDVDTVEIPGRNGDLLIDKGRFKNITVEYTVYSYAENMATFRQQLSDFRSALTSQIGYQRLTDTFHPDEYRLATFINGFEAEPLNYNTLAEITLQFDCKPQRFLTAGEVQQTIPSGSYTVLMNPTPFDALPLIEVEGTGTLEIADKTITIAGSSTQTLVIDSEMMEAYTIAGDAILPANNLIGFNDFPKLSPGENGIGFTGLTSVKITPRWWTL